MMQNTVLHIYGSIEILSLVPQFLITFTYSNKIPGNNSIERLLLTDSETERPDEKGRSSLGEVDFEQSKA
jgi:hypothetical protein